MGVSAAYLSRVETDIHPASAELTVKMSQQYGRPIEDFNAAAGRPEVSAELRGREIQSREELRVLYRLGSLTPEELERIINSVRSVLKDRGITDDEIEGELSRLRSELPRTSAIGDGLFAADIKPRFLSKRAIAARAYQLLGDAGLNALTYAPPTPVEHIVENFAGISYKIDKLPSKQGAPIVLGLSKWNGSSERQIVINSDLADNLSSTSEHRFNFTLAHELFHAIEHLPLLLKAGPNLLRLETTILVERDTPMPRRSPAERAVAHWVSTEKHGALLTNEDWREWQSNTFASCLLMPEWSVAEEFRRRVHVEFITVPQNANIRDEALRIAGAIHFEDIVFEKSLSDLFTVSRQAMAIRLLNLGLVQEVAG
jgi:Zn-dependent peptidase ImmA (M78 family)/transcriptional regulator with XRE-family HTH domain